MSSIPVITHDIDVVEAAERRIVAAFEKNKIVSFHTSGGKDSLCLADLLIRTMQKYNISFSRLYVVFFDEEAMFDDVIECTKWQRSRFMSLGAKFFWFCLPIRHYNCCSLLYEDESFICWEPGKEDKWVRPMPPFAIRWHKDFVPGMTYQKFAARMQRKIPHMTGMRMAESVQRRMALMKSGNDALSLCPIYDWKDNDVWLYLQRYNVRFPETYVRMWKTGVAKNRLRISQFFALDTVKVLPRLLETDPELADKVVRREPNAELAFLYWDTPMFRANGERAKLSDEQAKERGEKIDYLEKLREMMLEAPQYPEMYRGYDKVKKLYSMLGTKHSQKLYREMCEILRSGDAKGRRYRSLSARIINEQEAILDGKEIQ